MHGHSVRLLLLSYHIESSFALLMYENLMFHMEKKSVTLGIPKRNIQDY